MKFLKISAKLCLMLLASLFAGIFLLWCVFLLPDRLTQTHAARSAETFSYEGIGAAVGYTYADQLDNWTDALMIGNACYQKEDASALNRAAAAYRPDYQNGDPITSLDAYVKAEEDVGSIAYPRYWHGYLVALRPLLMVTDYLGIRSINTVFFAVTILLLVLVIIKRKQYQLFLPLGITILFLRPLAIIHSLQLSTVFYPTMLSVIVCIYFQKWMCREGHFLYLFLMNGIVIAYADLLTYPVASLGVLLTVFMMIQEKTAPAEKIRQIVAGSVVWGFGYFGMWAGKWLISSIILRQNVLADAVSQAQVRVSSSYGENHFSRVIVFMRNIGAGFIGVLVLAAVVFLLLTIFMLWRNRQSLHVRSGWRELFLCMLPYLMICLIPFAWYSVFVNHSYIHIVFTYRALAAAVCAWSGMCMVKMEFVFYR